MPAEDERGTLASACFREMLPATPCENDTLPRWPAVDEPTQTGNILTTAAREELAYLVIARAHGEAHQFASLMSIYATGDSYSFRHLLHA